MPPVPPRFLRLCAVMGFWHISEHSTYLLFSGCVIAVSVWKSCQSLGVWLIFLSAPSSYNVFVLVLFHSLKPLSSLEGRGRLGSLIDTQTAHYWPHLHFEFLVYEVQLIAWFLVQFGDILLLCWQSVFQPIRELLHLCTVDSLFFNQSESYYTFALLTVCFSTNQRGITLFTVAQPISKLLHFFHCLYVHEKHYMATGA